MLVESVDFTLTDHKGGEVSGDTYRGRWLLFFFGFTHCKSVCPRTLARLSRVIEAMGDDRELHGLYVTVDPERDTPGVLESYLVGKYPRFTGLTGSREAINQIKSRFGVFSRRVERDDGDYSVPHTSFTYLVDPHGRFRTHWSSVLGEDEIVAKLGIELGV